MTTITVHILIHLEFESTYKSENRIRNAAYYSEIFTFESEVLEIIQLSVRRVAWHILQIDEVTVRQGYWNQHDSNDHEYTNQ